MAYDRIDRDLIARFAGDRLECMPQREKAAISIDTEFVEQLPHFVSNGPVLCAFVPHIAARRDEQVAGGLREPSLPIGRWRGPPTGNPCAACLASGVSGRVRCRYNEPLLRRFAPNHSASP